MLAHYNYLIRLSFVDQVSTLIQQRNTAKFHHQVFMLKLLKYPHLPP